MRLLDEGFLLALAVAVAIVIASFILPTLILLILPSRKGTMRTVRQVSLSGTMDAAWDALVGRYKYEGFDVDESQRPARFVAARAGRSYNIDGNDLMTHATKPLGSEVTFAQAGGGVNVEVALWMKDFVFFDSGEGRQIDAMLDRLINQDLAQTEPPVTASLSYTAIIALTASILTLLAGSLPLLSRGWLSGRVLLGFGIGVGVGGVYAISVARQALTAIRAKPLEVTGTGMSKCAIVLGGVGIVVGAAWAIVGMLARMKA
jgi:hypothetical protein